MQRYLGFPVRSEQRKHETKRNETSTPQTRPKSPRARTQRSASKWAYDITRVMSYAHFEADRCVRARGLFGRVCGVEVSFRFVSCFRCSDRTGNPRYLCKISVSLRRWFSHQETLSFHARRRATLAIPIRHRDNLIAKEGRLYNTEPNLAVYF